MYVIHLLGPLVPLFKVECMMLLPLQASSEDLKVLENPEYKLAQPST